MEFENLLNENLALILVFLVALIFVVVLFRKSKKPPVPPVETKELEAPRKEVVRPWEKPVQAEAEKVEVAVEKTWMERLRTGLSRTQTQLVRSIDEFFISKDVKLTREQVIEQLFEVLIRSDLGVKTSEKLVARVREKLSGTEAANAQIVKEVLKTEILSIFAKANANQKETLETSSAKPHVVLMVGVNGVGKTTTTGKLAFKSSQRGKKVVVGAADTFRAAAVEQLEVWAKRASADFVKLAANTDPASVAFEATRIAKQKEADLCLVDTAGRLHNRQDLMQELAKIRRSVSKECEGAPHEVLLVLDATTGQNALQQARVFREIVQVTGLVLTKLDGTAKGGVAVAICDELGLPIRYIGVGETVEDLEIFNPEEFVSALFT